MNNRENTYREALLRGQTAFDEIAALWPQTEFVRLRWDNLYERYVTGRHQATYKVLFGGWPLLREWHSTRYVIGKAKRLLAMDRWGQPLDFPLRLPADAVVWGGEQNMFVASASAGKFLKLARGEWFRRQVLGEVAAWKRVSLAGMDAHIPKMLDSGETSSGAYWMCSQLVPHRPPLFIHNVNSLWLKRVQHDILPTLQNYYQQCGCSKLTGEEWLAELRKELNAFPRHERLELAFAMAEEALPKGQVFLTARSMVHGDIKPSNVHFHGKHWWLVDWTADARMAVIFDLFGNEFFFFYELGITGEGERFWNWLAGCGSMEDLPTHFARHYQIWVEWQWAWLGTRVNPEILRFQLLTMCVEWYLRMRVAWGRTSDERLFTLLGIPTKHPPQPAV